MIAKPQKHEYFPEAAGAAEKEEKLRSLMREMGSVLVAYSGGVDSSYLGLIATQVLGAEAVCVLGLSPSVSEFQRLEAQNTAVGFDFNFLTVETAEIENPDYRENSENRCYFCKSELYEKLAKFAKDRGIFCVIDGTNADDTRDHRPGRLAAHERDVRSPLAEAGLTKDNIRQLSKEIGLPGWDKPASPCLSSRIAHGVPVTIERLSKVEKSEQFFRELGFREFRVRVHGDLVRIEISLDEINKALNLEMINRITATLKAFGFRYVTLDLEGFRSGAMNVDLKNVETSQIDYREQQLEKV